MSGSVDPAVRTYATAGDTRSAAFTEASAIRATPMTTKHSRPEQKFYSLAGDFESQYRHCRGMGEA